MRVCDVILQVTTVDTRIRAGVWSHALADGHAIETEVAFGACVKPVESSVETPRTLTINSLDRFPVESCQLERLQPAKTPTTSMRYTVVLHMFKHQ